MGAPNPSTNSIEEKFGVFRNNLIHRCLRLLAVPGCDGVEHPEKSKSGKTTVEIAPKLAVLCAGFENVFDQPLIGTGKPADASTTFGRQKLR